MLLYKCKKKEVNKMTDKQRFFENAKNHGVDVVVKKNSLEWTTLNNEYQIYKFFDDNGKFVGQKTLRIA